MRSTQGFILAAVKYLGSHHTPIGDHDFDKECGVGSFSRSLLLLILRVDTGFSISAQEINSIVENYITSNNVLGWSSLGPVISALKGTPELKWANPLDVKKASDKVFLAKFGPKEAAKAKGKVSLVFDSQSPND